MIFLDRGEISCIDRNAMGVIKAFNAFLMAAHEKPSFHIFSLDKVIRAMAVIGRDISKKYKETSKGSLAVAMVDC